MPYRLSTDGKSVMVQRNGRWLVLHRHPSHAKALAHLRALYAHGAEGTGKRKMK